MKRTFVLLFTTLSKVNEFIQRDMYPNSEIRSELISSEIIQLEQDDQQRNRIYILIK